MEFHSHTLDNGLEIIAECNPEVHSSSVGFFVKTGSRDETSELAGVSHFLEHMVFKGTPTRSADEVNRAFDAMGADNNAYTSKEHTAYWAAVLPEYLEPTVELLADIMRPSLREEDFETEKEVIIEEIMMYDDQPPYGADERCEELHFGAHPLSKNVLGSVETIRRLPVSAMRTYFEQKYSPKNITVVGSGRIDFDHFVETTKRFCGHWEPFEVARQTAAAERYPGFTVIERPTSTQQYSVQLTAAPGAFDDLRYAADVLATVVGDSSGSRLYWALVDSGLAEHAGLYYVDYLDAGIFWTTVSSIPDRAEENLQAVLDIYRDVEREGITQAELDQAKSKTTSRLVLSSERPRRRLFAIGANWLQRHEYRTVREDVESVEKVTRSDIAQLLELCPISRDITTVTIGPLKNVKAPS